MVFLKSAWKLRKKHIYLEGKKIVAIYIRLTGSFEILRMNLGFNCNNFVINKIVYGLSKFKKIFFIFFDFIVIVNEQEIIVI